MTQLTTGSESGILISRPPRLSSAEVTTPTPPVYEPIPHTCPERPWDRLAISVKKAEKLPYWDEETPRLDAPLPEDAPNGSRFIGPILILAIEVLLGQRPCGILQHWLVPTVFAPLARRAGLAMRIHGKAPRKGQPRILTIIKSRPLPRVLEIAAAVHDGERVRAASMRMEFIRNKWRTVALEIG